MTARRWILPLVAITLCCATMATHAAAADIALPEDAVYPDNVAAGADGTLYVSSFVQGGILKVAPGATKAEVLIAPGAFGLRSTFGALPDKALSTLWICSSACRPPPHRKLRSAGPPHQAQVKFSVQAQNEPLK